MREEESLYHHYFTNDNGERHGKFLTYHVFNDKRGSVSIECNFNNGKLQGEYKSYHMNGQIARHMHMHVDCEHGDRKEYAESGKLTSHVLFIHGDMVLSDASKLSRREKFIYSMKHGVKWIKD